MIRHISLLTFHDTADAGAEAVQHIIAELREMAAGLEGCVDFYVGQDLGLNPDASDLAVIADFDSVNHYVAYRDDTRHQQILTELIKPILAARSIVQLDV